MNGYLREPDIGPFGPEPGFVAKFYACRKRTVRSWCSRQEAKTPQTTPTNSKPISITSSHRNGFSAYNLKRNDSSKRAVWNAVKDEVAVDRHLEAALRTICTPTGMSGSITAAANRRVVRYGIQLRDPIQ